MDRPFPKSTSITEKYGRLTEVIQPGDTLGIFIEADPDSMASALALRRLFWRRAKKTVILRINEIERADNLAFVRLLKIKQQRAEDALRTLLTRLAVVDNQPEHHTEFKKHAFDIIIDHHPPGALSPAPFIDINEKCGATSTMMTEYLRTAKIQPSPRLATALFYGIKTDTDNFSREFIPNDINAFKYLGKFAHPNTIKKIESSEMTLQTLNSYRLAMDRLTLYRHTAYIHMGEVTNPDVLVMIADFFMRLAEAAWAVVTGIYEESLIAILRNGGFSGNAGKLAGELFGEFGGTGGGHAGAARAEVRLEDIPNLRPDRSNLGQIVLGLLKHHL